MQECPTENDLICYGSGRMPEMPLEALEAHLEGCANCLSRLDHCAHGSPSLSVFLQETQTERTKTQFATKSPGEMLGGYRIVEQIAQGGIGTIYRCEHPRLPHHVAVKVVHADGEKLSARLAMEGQLLTRMSHPNIARIHDVLEDGGQLFLVMELIEGTTITEYCNHRQFDLKKRLKLFAQVCHAVHHAHQKSVVHRDLKPSNILVTDIDGQATIKVIDFGIAKDFSRSQGKETEPGLLIGTPHYMSPEQASLGDAAIDSRTDLFSLGIVLYELVAGRPPFTLNESKSRIVDLLHAIAHEEPNSITQALSESQASLCEIAKQRGTTPKFLLRQVRYELQWIVDKLLAKDPSHRYDSASAVARDIERFVSGDDVSVGPPSRLHRFVGAVRRHPALAMGVASIGGILLCGSAGFVIVNQSLNREKQARKELAASLEQVQLSQKETIQALQREEQAKRQSQKRFDQTKEAINHFYLQFAEDQDLQSARLRPLRKKLLQQALDYYHDLSDSSLGDDTLLVDLELAHRRIAEILRMMSEHQLALDSVKKALAIHERLEPTRQTRMDRADLYSVRATVLRQTKQLKESAEAFQQAVGLLDQLHQELVADSDTPTNFLAKVKSKLSIHHNGLGTVNRLTFASEEAIKQFERAVQLREECIALVPKEAANWRHLASLLSDFANALSMIPRKDDAFAMYDRGFQAIEKAQALSQPTVTDETWKAKTYGNRSVICFSSKEYQAASENSRLCLAHFERAIELDPTSTLLRSDYARALRFRASVLADNGEMDKVESFLIRSQDELKRVVQATDGDTSNLRDLAKAELELGKYWQVHTQTQNALQAFADAMELYSKVHAANPADANSVLFQIVAADRSIQLLESQGAIDQAESMKATKRNLEQFVEVNFKNADSKWQLIRMEDEVYQTLFRPAIQHSKESQGAMQHD